MSVLGQSRIISFLIRPPTFIKMSDGCCPISCHIQLSPIKSYGTPGTPPPSYSGFLRLYACLDKTVYCMVNIKESNPKLEGRNPVLLLLFLLLCHNQATPLDSETGWPEELWSKNNLLIWQTKRIFFFR